LQIKERISMQEITCFKAYDVRGRVPDQLNEDVAYRIGRAYADVVTPVTVVVGHDIRLSSEAIKMALVEGLRDGGVNVFDVGLSGTEEIYFATSYGDFGGGIIVTASHNPKDYNGMKFVREQSKPISGDTGLFDIKASAERADFLAVATRGSYEAYSSQEAYIQHLLSYVDVAGLKPLKIVANAGNGGAGVVVDAIESYLPVELIKVHHQADGNFPNGVPNPLLEENRKSTIDAVLSEKADMGIAWDGDFDRCFFFDENGRFIEGYYVVGLLAESFLLNAPGEKIVHDPRLVWNTQELVEASGSISVQSKTGHAFIKEIMRSENAIYGGEMSAHHYFRDFAYCDSGMIPWLLVSQLMSRSGKTLSELVSERMAKFPCSGEINSTIADPKAVILAVEQHYAPAAELVEKVDGLSVAYADWRFNLRMSNTEPVVRLNVESRADEALMRAKTEELLAFMASTMAKTASA
jgi:phosphomannomutase